MFFYLIFLLLFCDVRGALYYDSYHGTPITKEELKRHDKSNTTFWCTSEIEPCDPNEGRRIDGSCNNLEHPTRGTSHTPFVRVLPAVYDKNFNPRKAKSGKDLPLARHLRTSLISEGRVPSPVFTQLAVHIFVFMSADIVSLHDTVNYIAWRPYCCSEKGKADPVCVPNQVPDNDPVHRFSDIRCLNMTRPESFQSVGCIKNDTVPQRIVSSTPLLDLSHIYGNVEKNLVEKGRLFEGGLLKYEVENGRIWPPSTKSKIDLCLLNQKPRETRCHNTPEDGGNTLGSINLVSIWYWRQHNQIASQLAKINPCWDDNRLFYTAREINIAIALQIYYYELLPLFMGYHNLIQDEVISSSLGFRDSYNPNILPQMSLEYPFVLRWTHTIQEGALKMYDNKGHYLKEFPIVNLTLRTGYFAVDNNIDYITQGSFRQSSANIDYIVDPDIAETGLGPHQRASDLMTNDLAKNRYFGFQPYVKYREFCFGKPVKSFDDLIGIIDPERLEILREKYEHVEDIDMLAGIWVEKPLEGGFVPPTFYCLVIEQLLRNIKSDRHWYERPNRPGAFTIEQLLEIRKASSAGLVCSVGDSVTHIQPQAMLKAGPLNPMLSCAEIQTVNLLAWKDNRCTPNKRPWGQKGIQIGDCIIYDSFTGTPINNSLLEYYKKDDFLLYRCTTEFKPCDPNEPRRVNGTCNNLHHPSRGAINTPPRRVLPPIFYEVDKPRRSQSGAELPLVRRLRTDLLCEGRISSLKFTQLATYILVFMFADIGSIQDTQNYVAFTVHCCEPEKKYDPYNVCNPHKIPADDPVHRFSHYRCQNQTKSITFQRYGCRVNTTTPTRVMTATTNFDLSNIYDSRFLVFKKDEYTDKRSYVNGSLRYEMENGKIWPISASDEDSIKICSANVKPQEKRCNKGYTNSIVGSNMFTIWFYRNHLRIAARLAELNPCWDDDKLFHTAADINIAIYLQILFYELFPALFGRKNMIRDGIISCSSGHRNIYDESLIPSMSEEFMYILRWFHTMQEGRLKLYDCDGNFVRTFPVGNLTLRTGYLAVDDNFEQITQGSFRQASGNNDHVVDPDIAEFALGPVLAILDLFTNDLAKSRLLGFQPYVKYREFCTKKKYKTFDDLACDIGAEKLERLKDSYENVEDIDLMAGIWVENHIEGGIVPATLYCLMKEQLYLSVRNDRFWYENPNKPNALTPEQLQQIRKATIARFMCEVGDGVTKIQPHAFNTIGPMNRLCNCEDLPDVDLSVWKDKACVY